MNPALRRPQVASAASREGDTVAKTTDRAQRGGHSGVSIEDVAAAAGVSTATVSRAVRGLPRVSPATREKILGIAEDLGYVASSSASGPHNVGSFAKIRVATLSASNAGR